MGAGNPLLRSFDNDKFEPTTYFIDFRELVEKEDEDGNEISDSIIDEDSDMMFEDFVYSCEAELGLKDLHSDEITHEELSAAYRNSGWVLLEGNHSYIITDSTFSYDHCPIAIIPNFKLDDIHDELMDENYDKQDWYDARNLDFNAAMLTRAEKLYDKKIKQFHKEEKIIIDKLIEWYKNVLTVRNGAWTSSKIAA